MKRKITILSLALVLLFGGINAMAETELALYCFEGASVIANDLNLRLTDDHYPIGGDDVTGCRYVSDTESLVVLGDDDDCNITLSAGGGEYSLFGVSLGMSLSQAQEAFHDYCDEHSFPIAYEEWTETCAYVEFGDSARYEWLNCCLLSVIFDNGAVTEVEQYFL